MIPASTGVRGILNATTDLAPSEQGLRKLVWRAANRSLDPQELLEAVLGYQVGAFLLSLDGGSALGQNGTDWWEAEWRMAKDRVVRSPAVASREEARTLIMAVRQDAEAYAFAGRAGDRNRRVALTVIEYGLELGSIRFDLPDRQAAQKACLPTRTFAGGRKAVVDMERWFTWSGSPGEWKQGGRVRKPGHYRLLTENFVLPVANSPS